MKILFDVIGVISFESIWCKRVGVAIIMLIYLTTQYLDLHNDFVSNL